MYNNLTDEIKRLHEQYANEPSVDNLRLLQHANNILATELLRDKAMEGSTMAIIEYAKMCRAVPKIESYEDVAKLPNMNKDDLQVAVAQVQMKMRVNHITELNVESINDAYQRDIINYQEQKDLIQLLERNKKASDDHISGEMSIHIDELTNDAL